VKGPSEADKELPVLRVRDFLSDLRQALPARLSSPGLPQRFLLEAGEFVGYFNHVLDLHGKKAISRRTLQFYGSPQLRLFPLPIYQNRHTAHYVYPDHFMLLCVIWTLRERFFLPIKNIRDLIRGLPADKHELVIGWDGSAEELREAVPLFKAGFDYEDFINYAASKKLLTKDVYLPALAKRSERQLKKDLLGKLAHEVKGIREWISSGRGARYFAAMSRGRDGSSEVRERLARLSGAGEDGAKQG
jgi:hypothetical protein